jgi:hypothetical protein
MTSKQGEAASRLELSLSALVTEIGPVHAKIAILDALVQADLAMDDLRFLSRMLDRLADHRER